MYIMISPPRFLGNGHIQKSNVLALEYSIKQLHDMARYHVHPFYHNVASHIKSSFSQTWCSTFSPEAMRTISLIHFFQDDLLPMDTELTLLFLFAVSSIASPSFATYPCPPEISFYAAFWSSASSSAPLDLIAQASQVPFCPRLQVHLHSVQIEG